MSQAAVHAALIVAASLAFIAAVLYGISRLARRLLEMVEEAWPLVLRDTDAIARRFQGPRFRIGAVRLNAGGCYRIERDGFGVHLLPNVLARRFGFPACSLPWWVVAGGSPDLFGSAHTLTLETPRNRVAIQLPAWSVVDPPPGSDQPPTTATDPAG